MHIFLADALTASTSTPTTTSLRVEQDNLEHLLQEQEQFIEKFVK